VDAQDMPIRTFAADDTAADCTQADRLIEAIRADGLSHLKRWRGVATRYAKNLSPFPAAVHIRCIAIGLQIL
jgi:hypothetical protein